MYNKIASFILNSAKTKSLSAVFVAQPDSLKESLAGKVFVLAELGGKQSDSQKVFDFLVGSLEENYYNDEKILLRDKIEGLKIENIFEAALAKTNIALNDFFTEEKIKLTLNSTNLTVGVVFENKLHFSNFGKNRAWLIYRQKDNYEIINVETNAFEKNNHHDKNSLKNQTEAIPTKEPKIFSSVISGEIPQNAYFVFSSESLPEYLSEKELIGIISKLPPSSAASQIKNVLEKINNYVPFFGIIIKSATEIDAREIVEEIREPKNAYSSISSLNYTEKKTEQMLTSSGLISFARIRNGLRELVAKQFKKPAKTGKVVKNLDRPETLIIKNESENLDLGIIRTLSSVNKGSGVLKEKFSFKKNGPNLGYISSFSSWGVKLKILAAKLPHLPKNSFFSNLGLIIKNKINGLGGRHRLLFTVLGAVFLVLVASIYLTSLSNKNKAIKKEFADLTQQITDQEDDISARLLYDDVEGAKNILQEANSTLNKLPQKTKEQQASYSSLKIKLEASLEKIYKIKRLAGAEKVNDLKGLNISQLTYAADNLFALGEASVYKITPNSSSSTKIELADNFSSYAPKVYSKNIYYFNGTKISKLDPVSNIASSITLSELGQNIFFTNFNLYTSEKLYLLNKEKNQIKTYTKSGNSYGTGNDWFKESADLSKAVDLFINGSIYILNNDGSVLKYYTGNKQTYTASAPEPATNNFKKIIGGDKKLYLWDAADKRLAIINKDDSAKEDGHLISQYIFESLQSPSDLAIDEKNNTVYILDQESVYKFKLE
jgi:hypothetical protein